MTEKYDLNKAATEAAELKSKVDSGKAENYARAENNLIEIQMLRR